MFKLFLLFNIMILTSCGMVLETEEIKKYEVSEAFSRYVEQFKIYSKEIGRYQKIDDLIIKFDYSLNYPTLGTCTESYFEKIEFLKRKVYKTPKIDINPVTWSYMSEAERESLIFHELGHCLLNRGHDNSEKYDLEYGSNIPNSIMHQYAISSAFYENRYDHYIKELFNKDNTTVAYFEYDDSHYASTANEDSFSVIHQRYQQNGIKGESDCVHSKKELIIKEEN